MSRFLGATPNIFAIPAGKSVSLKVIRCPGNCLLVVPLRVEALRSYKEKVSGAPTVPWQPTLETKRVETVRPLQR